MGEWRYSSNIIDFSNGGEWSASRFSRFNLLNISTVPAELETPRTSESACTLKGNHKSLAPDGNLTPAVHPVTIPTELSLLHFLLSKLFKLYTVSGFLHSVHCPEF
jgi:hypothetical protein